MRTVEVVVPDPGHHPGLDGIRGVAILLVLGQHAPTRPLIDGFVGVTVFFCLSGYLVTTVLVRELQAGTIDVQAFYRRRAARLFPGLLTVVAATIVVLLIGRHDLNLGQILAPAGASVTYTTSLFDWTDHVFATKDYFNYTWSLSVEEQFYLLWPFALLWAYRRNPRSFAALIVWFIAITLALDLYLGLSRKVQYDQHEYFGSDTNALPVLVGSLLAIVVLNGWLSRSLRYLAPWALLAVALLPVLAHRNDTYSPSLVIVAGTGLTLVALVGVVTRPRSAAGSLLAIAPLRWLGERSYSIYLWNVLARIATLNVLGHTALGDLAWIAMFVVLAEASYRFVERPLRAKMAPKPGVPTPRSSVRPATVCEGCGASCRSAHVRISRRQPARLPENQRRARCAAIAASKASTPAATVPAGTLRPLRRLRSAWLAWLESTDPLLRSRHHRARQRLRTILEDPAAPATPLCHDV